MLAIEKAALMAMPVHESVAALYGTGVLKLAEVFKDPHGLIGNAMHVGDCGLVALAALVSVRLHLGMIGRLV